MPELRTVKTIKLADIDPSIGTQIRVKMDKKMVAKYAEHYQEVLDKKRRDALECGTVFNTPEGLVLADGFHRLAAGKSLKRETMVFYVEEGTREDAFVYACIHNGKHGLPLSNADKHNMAEMAVKMWGGGTVSDVEIGKRIGVSPSSILRARERLSVQTSEHPKANKGKRGNKPKSKPDARQRRASGQSDTQTHDRPETSSDGEESDYEGVDTDESGEAETVDTAPEAGKGVKVVDLVALKAMLKDMELKIGGIIRMVDEANAGRKYTNYAKAVQSHLGSAIGSLDAWKKGIQ